MRLIDADNLKDRFMAAVVADAYKPSYSIAEILIEIDHEPTVDAVPVVRCKDCRWAECRLADDDPQAGRLDCNHPDGRNEYYCLPDEFCDKGERRQEHETH